jgi:DNA processing protein
VGTRDPHPEAVSFTRDLVRDLCAQGYSIWSGGARGIDAAAHEAALASGAPTVVVTGGGLDWPYPRAHIPLFDRVAACGGALLARVPDHAPPTPAGFLSRNEVLAAITLVTVVIEAPMTSGARSTAAAARRFGRPLCVVPHAPWDDRGCGCACELARGARAITCAADVLAAITEPPPLPQRRGRKKSAMQSRQHEQTLSWLEPPQRSLRAFGSEMSSIECAVLTVLGEQPLHIDEICERAGRSLTTVVEVLLTLTLQAVVVEDPPGHYRRPDHAAAAPFPPSFLEEPSPESIARK